MIPLEENFVVKMCVNNIVTSIPSRVETTNKKVERSDYIRI